VGVKPTAGILGLALQNKTARPSHWSGGYQKMAALVADYLRRFTNRHMAKPTTDRAIVLGSGTCICEIV
jgi:hypothetical protein